MTHLAPLFYSSTNLLLQVSKDIDKSFKNSGDSNVNEDLKSLRTDRYTA